MIILIPVLSNFQPKLMIFLQEVQKRRGVEVLNYKPSRKATEGLSQTHLDYLCAGVDPNLPMWEIVPPPPPYLPPVLREDWRIAAEADVEAGIPLIPTGMERNDVQIREKAQKLKDDADAGHEEAIEKREEILEKKRQRAQKRRDKLKEEAAAGDEEAIAKREVILESARQGAQRRRDNKKHTL